MSELEIRQRRRRKREPQKVRTKVRIRHVVFTKDVGEIGTLKSLYEKYGEKDTEFWCGDIPPGDNESGYRLHPDPTGPYDYAKHMMLHGEKKAWVDLELSKQMKKRIVLVWNAGFKVAGMCDDCPMCNRDGCTFHENVFEEADKEDMRQDGRREE